jgi:hypothetical protein
MTLARITGIVVAAASLGIAGCAGAPMSDLEKMPGLSLAAAHSDITFTLTTRARQSVYCAAKAGCPTQGEAGAAGPTPFEAQVRRVTRLLLEGIARLYPDLAQRLPGLAPGGFDVYVAATDGPGSASSAGGRIALNSGLGELHPYDDGLAFVIVRELGHVIARHHQENSALSIVTSVIMNALLPGSGLVKSAASKVGSGLAVSSNRDRQVAQADAIALSLLVAAGFHLRDAALSLVAAPPGLNKNSWSLGFRKSSGELVAGVRGSKRAGAAGLLPAEDGLHRARRPDPPQIAAMGSPVSVAAVSVWATQSGSAATR